MSTIVSPLTIYPRKPGLKTTERVKKAFDLHRDYITHEVLATQVNFDCVEGTEWDLNGEPTTIALQLSTT